MKTVDVSHLPTWAYGSKNPLWWGNLGFMVIEGGAMIFAVATYLYLMNHNQSWPLTHLPELKWSTALMIFLLLSEIPNVWVKRAAKNQDLKKVRTGLIVMSLIGFIAICLRIAEGGHMNTTYDNNAYGSIVWFLLGLHTVHLITDWGETLVITVLMHKGPVDLRRFPEIQDNQDYWHFVVAFWGLIYFTLYWVPRLFEVKP
jgi:heme/copper-type cytochrome/quinol oxidase subunit 3